MSWQVRQGDAADPAPDTSAAIFESMSEGVLAIDPSGRLLAMNAAAERLAGRPRAACLGRRHEELFEALFGPEVEGHLRRVRADGTDLRFESNAGGQGRWLSNRLAPQRDGGLVVFCQDITASKRAQLDLAMLAAVSGDLLLTASEDDMMRTVGARIGGYLALSHCAFVEIDEAADIGLITHCWHRIDVPGLVGRYRISELVTEPLLAAGRLGETVAVRDTQTDTRTDPAVFAAMRIGSFLCVPLVQEGRWRFLLAAYHSRPHAWREDEMRLMREVSERIWVRLERLRAEAETRASEQRYRALFNSIDEGFYIAEVLFDDAGKAVDHRILEANPAFERHSGAKDPVGKTARQLVPGMESFWNEMFGKVALSGQAIRFEQGSEATQRWFDVFVSRVGDAGSTKVGIVFNDITASRLAEQSRKLSEARWRGLFENLHEGFVLGEVVLDESGKAVDWRYLEMNPGWEQITGWSRETAFGKTLRQMIPDVEPEWLHDFIEVAQTGVPANFTRHVAALNRWYEVHAFRPEPGRFAALFLEVTDRHLAQLRQRESEQQLQFVMDSMPQKVFTALPDGQIGYFNPQWMEYTGLPPEQVRDWQLAGFIHPDDLADAVRIWQQGFARSEALQVECRFLRADGKYCWHITRLLPMRDASGQISMWIGASTDIHEQREAAAALRELTEALTAADQRKTEFLATLAHELRNPLAPISNALQTLQRSGVQSAAVGSTLKVISRQVAQLVRLVDDLLDVSRITQGKIELRLERVDLTAVLAQAAETCEPTLRAGDHRLTLIASPQSLWLDGDPVRLAQVFGNLLNNAVKYGLNGGRIGITATREEVGECAWARVSVKDNGIGIAPDKIGGIFEMFSQVDPSLERARGGLGIGLMLVKKLVELHGGTIAAHSDGLGQGSEFVVRLPLALPLAEPLSAPEHPAPLTVSTGARCRVLVVDDNADAAETLCELLGVLGVESRAAFGGSQGVQAAEAFRPDVVLLDIGMPGMSGYEVARRLRAQPWGRSMGLVALTGWGQTEDREKSREAGFDRHLVKPLDFDALMRVLDEFQAAAGVANPPAQPLEER